ncbi:MAG: flagellar export chaperone FlgN [Oscillospiraceae bacterium]|nr:flagellar export chaperone FlgN [Oscillospiraceae bacterium]
MGATYASYLDLLRSLTGTLTQLTEVAKRKTQAVRQDDLAVLNECIKSEQALSLTLRGFEQKQRSVLAELSLTDVRLRDLPNAAPAELRMQTKEVVEALQGAYKVYRSASETALSTIECNLHEIEKVLATQSEDVVLDYPTAREPVDLPSALKTDFRA